MNFFNQMSGGILIGIGISQLIISYQNRVENPMFFPTIIPVILAGLTILFGIFMIRVIIFDKRVCNLNYD